jgi:hypothetical protein
MPEDILPVLDVLPKASELKRDGLVVGLGGPRSTNLVETNRSTSVDVKDR